MTAAAAPSAPQPPPSQGRRQALRDADKSNVLLVIDTYPIAKYYAVMDRLVMEFDAAVDARQLDQAYVYGIRFASFSLESLPKHKDYKKTFRKQKATQVEQVLAKLESVTERMDAEEWQKQQREEQTKRQVEEQRLRLEHAKRDKEEAKQREKEEKLRLKKEAKQQKEATKQQKETAKRQQAEASMQSNTKQSAMAKLQAMQHKSDMHMKKKGEETKQVDPRHQPDHAKATKPEEKKESRQDEEEENRKHQEEENNRQALQKERQRLAAHAERLVKQQREAGEEWETMKFLLKEAADGEREDAEIAATVAATKEKERHQKEQRRNAAAAAVAKKKKETTTTPRKTPSQATSTEQQPASTSVKPSNDDTTAKKTSSFMAKHQSPTICILPPAKKKSTPPYQPRGMSLEEKHTIEILEVTIVKQEERLADLEDNQIPALLTIAKLKLVAGDRKSAIFCMARKKKLDRTLENLKNAIFTMETQILMLESAVENRQVEKAMRAAADAMESLHGGVSVSEIHDVNRVVNEMAEGVVHDIYFDEDELLRELEACSNTAPTTSSASTTIRSSSVDVLGESQSILSLPTVPAEDLPKVETLPKPRKRAGLLAGWL
mmetsp:Transcript_31298/g.51664  ORF Transcript_31298/g.51664 Transcript_31298/m.51664 type:complete len:607 (+) Transcript_31298:63-1883(+)